MSKITLTPNANGAGTFTIASPNSNTNRTLTLPDSTGEILNASSSLNAANLTGSLPAISGANLTGIAPPFAPVAVTGTTPSLDVGSYNFFDNGTLTGDTTVSFASVPTNARWSYSFTINKLSAWDISEASHLQTFSVAAQDTNPDDVFFKPDGTKMYVVGDTDNDINEYNLSTAWDITTASFLHTFSVNTQETNPEGVFFKPDGLKMYVVGSSGDEVNEYNLSTAWNISTAVYSQLFSVSGQDPAPYGIFFKPDGLKMYVVGGSGSNIHEYNLSTAWNISTAVYLQTFSLAGTGPTGVSFKSDGLKMYIAGNGTKSIYEYDLSTAWDISSAVFLQLLSVYTQGAEPTGIFFKPDGFTFYVVDKASTFKVNQYDIGSFASITLPAAVVETPSAISVNSARVTYDFFTLDAGVTVNLIGEEIV